MSALWPGEPHCEWCGALMAADSTSLYFCKQWCQDQWMKARCDYPQSVKDDESWHQVESRLDA